MIPRRLRALFPLSVGAAAVVLYPDEWLWTGLLVALGFAGAASVWWSDSRSSLDAWRRRHPSLSFRRVTWFPADTDGGFDAVCRAVAEAMEALAEHPAEDRAGRARVRRTRRELDAMLESAARLALQLEQLGRLPESARTEGVRSEIQLAERRLAGIPSAAHGLRDALLRSGPTAAPVDLAPLAAVLTLERGLSAESEARAELGRLEVGL